MWHWRGPYLFVTLTDAEEEMAEVGGKGRQHYADTHDIPDYGEPLDPVEALKCHIAGCRGEIGTSKPLGLPWDPTVGFLTEIDVGGKVEVRSRRMPLPYGGEIFRRPRDAGKKHVPFVLVWLHVNGQVELRGWLYGKELFERKAKQPRPWFFYIVAAIRALKPGANP